MGSKRFRATPDSPLVNLHPVSTGLPFVLLFSQMQMTQPRRFPPPWTVDRPYEDTFVVKDAKKAA
jgi:hypothetical protein